MKVSLPLTDKQLEKIIQACGSRLDDDAQVYCSIEEGYPVGHINDIRKEIESIIDGVEE